MYFRTSKITSARGLSIIQTPKPSHKITSIEALSLLQTPEVKRCTPPRVRRSSVAVPTPQSILKVKKVISASPSPVSQPASADNSLKSTVLYKQACVCCNKCAYGRDV